MGTWGFGPFENDDALDWLAEAADEDASYVTETLADHNPEHQPDGDYLEAPQGAAIVAAAAVVALAKGLEMEGIPDEVSDYVGKHREELLTIESQLIAAALDAVRGADSELADLFESADSLSEWTATLDRIQAAAIS